MQQLADISLSDGTTARTFSAQAPQNGTSPTEWAYKAYTPSSLWTKLKLAFSGQSVNRPTDKWRLVLSAPQVQVVGGVDTVTGVITYDLTVTSSNTVTETHRGIANAFFSNALSQTLIKGSLTKGEGVL